MMTTEALHYRFFGICQKLVRSASRARALYVGGSLTRDDLDLMYRSVIMKSFVALERAIEEGIIGVFCGRLQHPRPAAPRFLVPDEETLTSILTQQGRPIDWLPANKYEEISIKLFGRQENPFLAPSDALGEELKACQAIRNYIAHESPRSLDKLMQSTGGFNDLPKSDRDLLGYLDKSVGGTLMLEAQLNVLVRVSHLLFVEPVV